MNVARDEAEVSLVLWAARGRTAQPVYADTAKLSAYFYRAEWLIAISRHIFRMSKVK